MLKTLFISPVSASFIIDENLIYYVDSPFDVFLNDEKVLSGQKHNVFSLYDLVPGTKYEVNVNDEKISFITPAISKALSSKDFSSSNLDVTNKLQQLIDSCPKNGLVIIEEGIYHFTSLKLKSNMTFYLKKGAILEASIKEDDYKEIEGEILLPNGELKQLGTWEGSPCRMKLSLINVFDCSSVFIVGQGIINANADKSTWWENVKTRSIGRPHILFYAHSNNIYTQGIKLMNSPQWTIHPYFCSCVEFYDFMIENPPSSPNTDGLNPQCCDNVKIYGIHFSVGDDCIAIKSGKMYIGQKYKTPSSHITISNCLMQYGHGAVVLGSEMSGGIKNLTVKNCIFDHTDRGLRIKTRRGRGNTALIDDVTFSSIIMKNVLSPLTINMFYFCDPDGKSEYVWSKEKLPVDERTPYLGKFTFKDIIATDCEYCAGYFYGLPEQPIEEINIISSSFSFKENAKEGTPVMMSFAEVCHKKGFTFNNVNHFSLKDVKMEGQIGEIYYSSKRG